MGLFVLWKLCLAGLGFFSALCTLGRLRNQISISKVKLSLYRPEQAQRVDRGIALSFLDPGARRGWVVSTVPRPLYTRETPGTHYTGGWVGPRAGLDVCEKSSPHQNFCLFHNILYSAKTTSHTAQHRDKHLTGMNQAPLSSILINQKHSCIASPDRPARSQSLYRLSYPAHYRLVMV
jgi:hypothetical protein